MQSATRRRGITRRALLQGIGASVLAAAASATGCGQPPAPAAAPKPAEAPKPVAPTPAAAPTAAPAAPTAAKAPAPAATPVPLKVKQDIVMGIGTDVGLMDIRIAMSAQARSQIMHVTEQPIYPDDSGKLLGILVSAWEPMTNPPGWRLKLRPGIKFTNGELCNAQAIKSTFDTIFDEANKSWVDPQTRTKLGQVKEVKIEDDLTVVMPTKTFYRTLPIQFGFFGIMPPKYAVEKGKEFGVNPVGTGHYKFGEYRSKSHLYLEAVPDYHGHWGGPAKNSSVRFRYLSENATRVAALEAGEVHVIDNLPPDTVDRIKRNPNLDVLSTSTVRINVMDFHAGRPPFNNLKARLAVVHAIDRDALVKKVMGGMTDVATTPYPPGTLGTVGETFAPFPFDPKKAKQYFAEAGLTNGTRIKVGGPVGRYVNDKQVVTAIAGMIAEVGFDPELEQPDWATYWAKCNAGYYDMSYVGWAAPGYDPDDLRAVYMGLSADNAGYTHFVEHNKRVVELFKGLDETPSQQDAERYAREFMHLIWDNQPAAYLFYEPNIAGVSRQLKGWKPRRDTMVLLWDAYLG